MSVNNKTKSDQDLVKVTKQVNFLFYSREYMLRPETQEKMKLLWEFLRAAGFHGVRLRFEMSALATDMTSNGDQSAVTSPTWGSKQRGPPPRKKKRRDPCSIDLVFGPSSGWPIKVIHPVDFEEAICYFWVTFGWFGLPQILAEKKSSSN